MKASVISAAVALGVILLPATVFAKPDLVFTEIDGAYDPNTDLVTLDITVKNIGDEATEGAFFVDLFGAEKGNWGECAVVDTDFEMVVPPLGVGLQAEVTVEMDLDFTTIGPLYFFVDIDERIFEEDEGNNEGVAYILEVDPNEDVVVIDELMQDNPVCLQDEVFNLFGVNIPAALQMFYSKLRIRPG